MTEISLGEFLRQEREKRGITLDQVASATKINVRVLHFLESDQYSDLPAKPFVRGFVNSYARFIGLDVQVVLTRFSEFLEEKSHERPTRDAGHTGYAFEKKESDQNRVWLWGVLSGFAVVCFLGIVIFKPKLGKRHRVPIEELKAAQSKASPGPEQAHGASPLPMIASVIPTTGTAPVPTPVQATAAPAKASPSIAASAPATPAPIKATPAPTPTPRPKPTPGPSPTPSPDTPADPLNKGDNLKPNEVRQKMVLKALDDVSVRYIVDGKKVTQFILRKGTLLMMKAKENIVVQVSDQDRVAVKYKTGDFVVFNSLDGIAQHNDRPTLIRPIEMISKFQDPFPNGKPLQSPPVGAERPALERQGQNR